MKKSLIIFLVSVITITLMSAFSIYYTSGCPYHSGSPADGLTCASCHAGGAITPSVTISSIPAMGIENKYIPGTTYTLSIAGSGYAFYGFDLEILNSQSSNASTALDFGTITSITPDEAVNTPLPGFTYSDIMHTSPKSGSFTAVWTAPSSGTGYLYCALLGINNNGNTSGDKCCITSMTLSPSTTSSISEHIETDDLINISVYPNPSIEKITISYNLKQASTLNIELLNDVGAKVADIINEKQNQGKQEINFIFPRHLQQGIYFIKIDMNKNSTIKKITLL
jgi:hypothetical protein